MARSAAATVAVRQRAAFREIERSMLRRRGKGAPLRNAFFHTNGGENVRYPLAELMSSRSGPGGGRGGKTRVALYLSLLWVAAGGDHSSRRPASFWAELLGLPEPASAGARAVRSTWQELERRGYVKVSRGDYPGDVRNVHLLREDGSGEPYTIPTGEAGDTYRRIPEAAWRSLLAEPDLTGPGLAMYLVALRTAGQADRLTGLVFPPSYFRTEYGLGESTRKAGLRNLTDMGVLDAHLGLADDFGGVGGRRRQRTTYDLLDIYAEPPADLSPTE